MNDFMNFKKMVTPVVIQILFWIGILACIIAGFGTFSESVGMGLLIIFVGPLAVRIYCELLIVIFSINDSLTEVKNLLKKDTE